MNRIELVRYIISMVQNGDYVCGHSIFDGRGNPINIVNKILNDGLIIEDASRGLAHTSRMFEYEFKECLENFTDLCVNSSGFLIILAIPKELLENYESRYFYSCDSSSIVLEFTGENSKCYKDAYGNPTKIAKLSPMYILGYFDVKRDIFIKNTDYAFDTYKKSKNISNLKATLDDKYEKMLINSQYYLEKRP